MTRLEFELQRAEIAESGVQTLTIVPTFDVLEDGCSSLGTRGKLRNGTLGLESGEETFHGSIVEAVSDAAHADLTLMSCQALKISLAGVLATLIGVMQ